MDSINNAISASLLTRALANIFVFLGLCAALFVGMYEILSGQTPNPIIVSVLSTGLGYAIHLLGLNQGVTLTAVKTSDQKGVLDAQSLGAQTQS